MTEEEIDILTSASVRAIIRENLHTDPATFALSLKDNFFSSALVSTQLKYLQKARHKLPTYYNQLCIIPPLAYQQSSSEQAASLKNYTGKRCLDLTMGLGVDAWHFSHHFDEVHAVEPNEELVWIGKKNFHLLSRNNIDIHHLSAESYLEDYQGPPYDLIYIDPARRDSQGRKIHDLEACFPNVIELMPLLKQHGKRIVIKASPLFDIGQARKKIPDTSRILVNSIQNEVKELILEVESQKPAPKVPQLEVFIANRTRMATYDFDWKQQTQLSPTRMFSPIYLYEADVAFYKIRQLPQLFSTHFDSIPGFLTHEMGFFLSSEFYEDDFPGRIFKIKESFPYKPKKIKKYLKEKKIQKLHIAIRNFPFSVAQIRKQLHVAEGGEDFLIATHLNKENRLFLTERLA